MGVELLYFDEEANRNEVVSTQQPLPVQVMNEGVTDVIEGYWDATHVPVADTIATATSPTRSGMSMVCTHITVVFAAGASAPSAATTSVTLKAQGLTRWGMAISVPATAGLVNGVSKDNLLIKAPPGEPFTLAFAAAGGANTFESVAMSGYYTRNID